MFTNTEVSRIPLYYKDFEQPNVFAKIAEHAQLEVSELLLEAVTSTWGGRCAWVCVLSIFPTDWASSKDEEKTYPTKNAKPTCGITVSPQPVPRDLGA